MKSYKQEQTDLEIRKHALDCACKRRKLSNNSASNETVAKEVIEIASYFEEYLKYGITFVK